MSRTPEEYNAMRVCGNAIVAMAHECQRYSDAYETLYDQRIAYDGVLGDAVLDILQSLRVLLNGELGAHDPATLDRLILDVADKAGFGRNI